MTLLRQLKSNVARIICKPNTIFKSTYCDTAVRGQWPRKVFSGIQPTGAIHIGNYLGAVSRWVELQNNDEDVTFSIVDLHSITLHQERCSLNNNILQMTAALLACGIDPERSTLFVQSSVPQHTSLCWVLGCLTTMARLSHLPQYKEKSSKMKDIPLGLYVYPVLQAADILLYKATHIPVGEDQVQHLQLAQHLARLFNLKYGETFPNPHALIASDNSSRVKSLRDPTKKMSKSDPDPKSSIMLTDTPKLILEKIKKGITDFTSEVTYEPEQRPGVANLITIHSLMSGKTPEEICEESKGIDTGKYKLVVADAVISHINPIQKEISHLLADPGYLLSVLQRGTDKAGITAQKTWAEVKGKVGLGGGMLEVINEVTAKDIFKM